MTPPLHGPRRASYEQAAATQLRNRCARCKSRIRAGDKLRVLYVNVPSAEDPEWRIALAHRRGHCHPIRWTPRGKRLVRVAFVAALLVTAWLGLCAVLGVLP